MSDVNRLTVLLNSGTLLHPVSDALSIVDFANALHSAMGIPHVLLNKNASTIKSLIGEPKHLVLVIADGFGMNFVEALDADAFIPNHLAAEMRTVFPSTTPIALTTLATGLWPAKHAVIGWFLRLREINAVSTIISYSRTADKKPLSELGVSARGAYPVPSRIGGASKEALHVMPEQIVGSVYSNYWTGGIAQAGYEAHSPQQAVQLAVDRIRTARAPTFVYLYMPQVDSAAHARGASHANTLNAVRQMDALLETLNAALPENARLIMTADHGHLDAPNGKSYTLDASDEIMSLCNAAPTGDFRAVYVDVTDERMDAFRRLIHRRFGDDFLVLTASEIERVGLFGQGALSEDTRARMGSALALSTNGAVFDYRTALGEDTHPIVSHHGGLTPAEMRIPLVVA